MPKDFGFEGSGFKGAEFEQKGMEQRNLTNLLKILGKQKVQKSIESLAKIKPDVWKSMAMVSINLRRIVDAGGISSFTRTITDTVKLQIDSMMSGITNEVNSAITEIIMPFLSDVLQPMINELNTFLSENKVGSGVGGIIGGIAGLFLPTGPIVGSIIGAIVGSIVEVIFTAGITGVRDMTTEELLDDFKTWRIYHPDSPLGDYMRYLLEGESRAKGSSAGYYKIMDIEGELF